MIGAAHTNLCIRLLLSLIPVTLNMSLYIENCLRYVPLLSRHPLTALHGIIGTTRFTDQRHFLCSSVGVQAEKAATRVGLPFAGQPLSRNWSKSLIVSQAVAYSSYASDLAFNNILSSANLERCRNVLQSQKSFDLKNQPWLRGKNISDMRPAAVLIPLCLVDGQPSVLFTLRSNQLPTHKGEVCFPGGMVSKADSGFTHTALRELEEEIGLKSESVDVIGQMHPVPGANYAMLTTPILGFCGVVDLKKLKVDKKEVEDVFVSKISSLCDKRNFEYTTYKLKHMYTMPVYTGQKYKIWGMTAFMLHQALKLVAPGLYSSEFRSLI